MSEAHAFPAVLPVFIQGAGLAGVGIYGLYYWYREFHEISGFCIVCLFVGIPEAGVAIATMLAN